jgi:hypothetical protein
MKYFLIALFIFNIVVICTYLILTYFRQAYLSDMNFTLLIIFGISTNIVIGELMLKHNAIYGKDTQNKAQ